MRQQYLLRSLTIAAVVAGGFLLHVPSTQAATSCSTPPSAPSAPYNSGFADGCKRGTMNWKGDPDSCSTSWLSATTFAFSADPAAQASEKNIWSSGCADGYGYGRDEVLLGDPNGVLKSAGTSLSDIGTACRALPGFNTGGQEFLAGCRTGQIGKLMNYPSNDSLVCAFLTGNTLTGCNAGYAAAGAAPAATPPPAVITPPPPTGAIVTPPPAGTESTGKIPSTVPELILLIKRLTNWMFTFLLLIAVIMIIYAAFLYLTSGGGEEVGKAHKMLVYSAIAIAVGTLAQGVVTVVQKLITI